MAPDLALSYDSQSGNGPLGVGWDISDLSGISRCGRTVAQDGVIGSVNYDANDRYCLDGHRLVPESGSYTGYGGNGVEYRTEIDGFSRIISYGSAGNGPAWFKVWTKGGEVLEYGNTLDSRIEAQGKTGVRVWAINKRTDVRDNALTYHYIEDSAYGDFVIDEIRYTGNSTRTMSPDSRVKFVYDATRPDREALFAAESRIIQTRRLARLETHAGTSLVREYRLTYGVSEATGRSVISAIAECAGGTCLPALSLQWSGSAMTTVQFPSRTSSTLCANGSSADGGCNDANNHYSIQYPDINGDGRADLCYRSDAGIRCLLSTGTTWDRNNPILTNICADSGTTNGVCNDTDNYDTISYADINGDGFADLIVRGDQGVRIWLFNGSGFSAAPIETAICANNSSAYGGCNDANNHYSIRFPDINGDSRADLCFRSDSGITCFLSTGSGLNTAQPILTNICADWSANHGVCNDADNFDTITYADINGDGRDDIVYRGDQGIQVVFSTGNGFDTGNRYSTTLCANSSDDYGGCRYDQSWLSVVYTDVTGSGLLDLCYRSDSGFRCYQNIGGKWDLTAPVINSDICARGSTHYACAVGSGRRPGGYLVAHAHNAAMKGRGAYQYNDLNGDGRSDLIYRGSTGIQVWLSTGTSFSAWRSYDICGLVSPAHGVCNDQDNYQTIQFVDIDGNGVADLVYRGDEGVQLWRSQIAAPDLLTSITNGLGHVTSITYKPITDPAVHTKDANSVYPVRDMQFSMYVVSAVSGSNGIGGTVGTTHRYGGLKVHQQGRGLLGFRWTEAKQSESSLTLRTEYRQDWPYIGYPSLTRKVSATNVNLSQTGLTYQCKNTKTGGSCAISGTGHRFFPFVSQSVDQSRDLNNSVFPSVTTTTQYDNFGNATQVNTSAGDGHSKSATNTYTNTTAGTSWILGRLTRVQVINAGPGVPNLTRTSAFVYDSYGQLAKEIVEPGNANLCLVTAYERDPFGNKQNSTVRNCNGSASEAAAPTGDAVFAARTATVWYDSRGRFPLSGANALNQTESRTYHPRTGAMTRLTDANNLTTDWQQDAFGRQTLEIRPNLTRTRIQYLYCSGVSGGTTACPTHAKYMVEVTPLASNGTTQIGPWIKTYYDMADREVRAETQGFDGTSVIRADTQYDALGRVSQSSRPYYVGQTIQWTIFAYDALGRTRLETRPDGAQTEVIYNGIITTVKDALGRSEGRTVNSQGQVVAATDAASVAVTFQYDAVGNLLKTTDPAANVVQMSYDLRGRKTGMTDPDMGTWAYTYNALGELVRQTDAKSQVSTLQYDLLGRMTRRTEPDLVSNWYYDRYKDGQACDKGIGRLCQAESNNGYSRRHRYDNQGRMDQTQTTVGVLDTLTTGASYDAHGRLNTLDYPASFGVKHVYTPLGYLK